MNLGSYLRRSLKTRVTLFTLVIFLCGIWSLAFYASRMLREDMQRLLGEQQFSTASIVAAQLNDELVNRLTGLEKVADAITPAMMNNPAALQARLEGGVIFLALFNNGVAVSGADGTVIADAPRLAGRIGTNFMDRDYAIGPLREGKTTIGRPAISKVTKAPTFVMAVPIRDVQGKVIGVLVGVTDLGKPSFLDKITEGHYGNTGGYILIAAQHRLIVTASDKSRVMQPVSAPGVVAQTDRFIQGYEGYAVYVNPRGEEVLNSSKRVPAAGWNLAVTIPTAEAFAPIRAMQQRMLLATILLTLIAGGLTWWMLKRQLSPMLAAANTLAKLADANGPAPPLRITSEDEIGELIGAFNHLLETLGQREEALKKSEGWFRILVEHSPLSMALVCTDGTIEYINHKAIETFGYLPQDIPNMDRWWVQAYPDANYRAEVIEAWMQLVANALANKHEIERREYRVTCKNGNVKIVAIFGVWVTDKVLVIFEDITERKQAEAEHARLEAQLRESQKMEALGTMAGGVAHDFDNALAAIIGNVELVRQDVGPAHPALESLEEIGKASRRAKDLVQQILAFGRRQKLDRKPTSLALVVVETARLVRATLPAMVALGVECEADTPAVLADATQVKQILLNLCSNALQAVQDQERPGVINVRLYLHTQGEARGNLRPGRYACLAVRDNGLGMDEATRSHIFEPFFTTKPVGKGTGLGLSVVHGIIQAHEAHVEVESAAGEGSTFRIYFPAVETPVADVTAPAPDTAPARGKGEHVLYVDDEEAIIFLMTRLLQRQGFRVSGYTDPQEALAAVRADPGRFDLAVTDYSMPGMSGLEVARALKEIRADLPVVLASGYITEELRAKAPAAGVCELIYKPNTVEDLCEAVARLAQATAQTPTSS